MSEQELLEFESSVDALEDAVDDDLNFWFEVDEFVDFG